MKRFIFLLVFAISCSGGDGTTLPPIGDLPGGLDIPGLTDILGADISWDVAEDIPIDRINGSDTVPQDVVVDQGGGGIYEEPENCPGEFLCPCTDGTDCFSGHCIETMYGYRCSRPCDSGEDSCPLGWRCGMRSVGSDSSSVCLAPATQCRPCKTNEDCRLSPWGPNVCLSAGPSGSFCGVSCSEEQPCESGYECVTVPYEEDVADVCRPKNNGPCPCTQWFADQHFTTECYIGDNPLVCRAERSCNEQCQPAGEPEICDGLDNDCDGIIDNGCDKDGDGYCDANMVVVGTPNVCPHGGGDCDDNDPYIHPGASERCNGKDDDCDGRIDNIAGTNNPILSTDPGDGNCSNKGICAAGVPRKCVNAQWECDYNSLLLYQNPELTCDNLDNNCNGCVDEGLGADSQEPYNDTHQGSKVLVGGTLTDCDNSLENVITEMTLHRRADCTPDVDWYAMDYKDHTGINSCSDNPITVQFTHNPMGYTLCAYFKCNSPPLKKFLCEPGVMVTDGPRDIDPGGYGCCCTGGLCSVGISSTTSPGGPNCTGGGTFGLDDSGKVYIKVFSPTGVTDCLRTYAIKAYGY